jgi:maleate isomerase
MKSDKIASEIIGRLERILDRLRRDTGAGRATIRLDHRGLGSTVKTPAAESLAEDVTSLKPYGTLDQWNGAAIKWMLWNKRTFVMNDCLNPMDPELAPHPDVVGIYGIRSEMLAPLIKDGTMFGWISVHRTQGPHEWTKDEMHVIELACQDVLSVLEELDSSTRTERTAS